MCMLLWEGSIVCRHASLSFMGIPFLDLRAILHVMARQTCKLPASTLEWKYISLMDFAKRASLKYLAFHVLQFANQHCFDSYSSFEAGGFTGTVIHRHDFS